MPKRCRQLSEGLAQGPCVVGRVGFEPVTRQTQGTELSHHSPQMLDCVYPFNNCVLLFLHFATKVMEFVDNSVTLYSFNLLFCGDDDDNGWFVGWNNSSASKASAAATTAFSWTAWDAPSSDGDAPSSNETAHAWSAACWSPSFSGICCTCFAARISTSVDESSFIKWKCSTI